MANTSPAGSPKDSIYGNCHPPRYNVTIKALEIIILAYSARKKPANFMLLYSVWKPPTSSGSASGRSKGRRLVSANADTRNVINPIG